MIFFSKEKLSLFAKEKVCYRGSSYSTKRDFSLTRVPEVTVVSTCDSKAYCYGGANIMFALSGRFYMYIRIVFKLCTFVYETVK